VEIEFYELLDCETNNPFKVQVAKLEENTRALPRHDNRRLFFKKGREKQISNLYDQRKLLLHVLVFTIR
jgi:hypothetical protein